MEAEIVRLTPYIFFFVALLLAGASGLRLYQRSLHASALGIRNRQTHKRQEAESAVFFQKKSLVDRKQQIVDALVENLASNGQDVGRVAEEDRQRRELIELRKKFDAQTARGERQRSAIESETEELLATHRTLHRRGLLAEIGLLVLSLAAAVGVMFAAGQTLT